MRYQPDKREDEQRRRNADPSAWRMRPSRRPAPRRRGAGRSIDLDRIDPHRLGDGLQPPFAEIANRNVELPSDLVVGGVGEADAARRRDALEPGGDIDAVAHEVAVALDHDIAEIDADPELDAPVARQR